MKLNQIVSHNFSFVGNAAIFSPEDGNGIFWRNFSTYKSTWCHNPQQQLRQLHHREKLKCLLRVYKQSVIAWINLPLQETSYATCFL
jgi:hypothetical protein